MIMLNSVGEIWEFLEILNANEGLAVLGMSVWNSWGQMTSDIAAADVIRK